MSGGPGTLVHRRNGAKPKFFVANAVQVSPKAAPVTAIQLCELLLTQSLSINAECAERWTNSSYRVAHILPEHSALVIDLQQIGRLDCVVRELEGGVARILTSSQPPALMFAPDFCTVLAKAWLSLTYEVLRTIKQRLWAKSELRGRWTGGIAQAYSNLERVRMEEIKREIAQGSKLKQRVELFVPGGEHSTTKEYVHGQTVVHSPLALRPTDGSVVWHAFNRDLGRSEELYRRDMSEHLLCELEKL
jgi:hypothetical protein